MPTEHQELDNQSLSILYGENLYQIEPPQKKNIPAEKEPKKDSKNIVIIIRDQLHHESTTYQMFLNLLKACNLTVDQIELISPYTFELTSTVLVQKHKPSHIIMFGVGSSEIGLSVYFPDYQVQSVDGVTYLTAPDLILIENDKDIKAKLWQSLKKAFSL